METASSALQGSSALDAIAEAAADWLVRLHAGVPGDEDVRAGLEEWLRQDPRHAQVWQEMAGQLAPAISCIREADRRTPGQAEVARRILEQEPLSRRRMLLAGVGLGAAGLGAALMAARTSTADFSTHTGQVRSATLADGSVLTLGPHSLADLTYGEDGRQVRLRQGRAVVAAQPGAQPFVLATDAGTVRTNGARFLVERREDGLRVAVLSHGVEVEARHGDRFALRENEVAALRHGSLKYESANAHALAAWTEGLLDVRDGTLGEVVDALRDWRSGLLRITEGARRLPVFGVFRLDDIDRTLDDLASTLPITVRRLGPLLAWIDLR